MTNSEPYVYNFLENIQFEALEEPCSFYVFLCYNVSEPIIFSVQFLKLDLIHK